MEKQLKDFFAKCNDICKRFNVTDDVAACFLVNCGEESDICRDCSRKIECCKMKRCLDKIKKLEQLTNLFEKTFDWGCNDTARDLYANAVYAVVSGNEIFKECVEQFEEHVLENL